MPARESFWRRSRRWWSFGDRENARLRREIDDEIASHLAARVEHLIAHGMTPEAARAEALRRFGDLDAGRARLHDEATSRRRRLRLGDRLDAIRQDVRYVARTLGRSPAFTAGVVFTFALGLGINAAIFRIADLVLLRAPAGVRDASSLRQVETIAPGVDAQRLAVFSWPEATRLAASHAFAGTSLGTTARQLPIAGTRQAAVAYADDRFFALLGTPLVAGRAFSADEARPGSLLPVAIVSEAFWKRELGGGALSSLPKVTVRGRACDVVGVTAAGFIGIDLDPTDIWLPLGVADLGQGFVNGVVIPWYQADGLRAVRVIGRLATGASAETARAQIAAEVNAADADASHQARITELRPLVPVGRGPGSDTTNRVLLRLAAVAGFVLLIAAANATNLLLARGIRRQPELAIRAAIGASRARLCALLVVESTMLALAGGATAVVAGAWTAEALRNLVFPDARWTTVGFDVRTVFFVGTLTVLAGLAAGLAPTLQATGLDLHGTLKDGRGRGGGRTRRTRAVLLIAQTSLALVLMIASGLLVASLLRLNHTRIGFDPPGLITASLSSTSISRAARGVEPETMSAFLGAIRSTPEVGAIAIASVAPFGASSRSSFRVPGSSYVAPSPNDEPLVARVSPGYFAALGTRVLRGRTFTEQDVATGAPVAMVNASMARAYWGDTIPDGGCILVNGQSCAIVVGVVEDMRESPAALAAMRYYLPLYPETPGSVAIIRAAPAAARTVVDRLRAASPADYRSTIEVTADRLDRALRPWRAAAWLFLTLGAIALALACGGIYSVMSYVAAERRQEIGVRIALGASRRDVLGMIVIDGMRLVIVGGAIGAGSAALLGRFLGTLLYDVSTVDPIVYAASLAGIGLAAMLATLLPAARASRVDPVVALRQE